LSKVEGTPMMAGAEQGGDGRYGKQSSFQIHGTSPEPRGHARHVPPAQSCGQFIAIGLSVP
jgi:hypothetical protein